MTSTSKASILIFYLSLLTQSITLGFSTVSTRNLSFKHATSVTSKSSNTRLSMIFRGKDYDRVVEGIMVAKGLTREEAEADYNLYLENPNNYALNKGEEYYKSLGYKNLMEGVVGEAEKEGKGDEVRERIAAFKKQSQLKATAVLIVAFSAALYWKANYVPDLY